MDLFCLGNEFSCGSSSADAFGTTTAFQVKSNNLREGAVFGADDGNLINHAFEIGLRIVVPVTVNFSCFLNKLFGCLHNSSASVTRLLAIKVIRWSLPKLPVDGADDADRRGEIDIFDKGVVILITVDFASLGDKYVLCLLSSHKVPKNH